MSETGMRRGTREKKPSRQYWFDEADFSAGGASRTQEQKERYNNAQDHNQLAKILCKFLNSANQNAKQLPDSHPADHLHPHSDLFRDHDHHSQQPTRRSEGRSIRQNGFDPRSSRARDGPQSINGEGKGAGRENKSRNSKVTKSSLQLASLETDMNYHNALGEHVKNAYPNINTLSADMLMELSIPTEILGKQTISKSRGKEDKKSGSSKGKEENKPFKRQSYHVAIAYHIHLKQVKNSKPVEYVDPTYPARRLKEQQISQEPRKP